MRARYITMALFGAACWLAGCGSSEPQPQFVQRMITLESYQPPSSASRDTLSEHPVLYLHSVNGQLRGLTNADPNAEPRVGAEVSVRNLIGELQNARVIAERMLPDSLELPGAVNLVLDRNLGFAQVGEAMMIAGRGTFQDPYLVTAEGFSHDVDQVMVHPQIGPVGWSAWVWWMPDNSLRYIVWPDQGRTPEMFNVVPDGDTADFETLTESLAATMDTSRHIPEPMERQVGIWAYEELPYSRLIKLMDAMKYPSDGPVVAGRFAFLAGERWGPPEPGTAGRGNQP